MSGQDEHSSGHLGKTWEVALGVALGASPMYLCTCQTLIPPLSHPRSSALRRSSHDSHRYDATTETETATSRTVRFTPTSNVLTLHALRYLKGALINRPTQPPWLLTLPVHSPARYISLGTSTVEEVLWIHPVSRRSLLDCRRRWRGLFAAVSRFSAVIPLCKSLKISLPSVPPSSLYLCAKHPIPRKPL